MNITITRTYYPEGTNGMLYINGVFQCFTIELPWLDNRPRRSCIPEGEYVVAMRWSKKFGEHLLVQAVPRRSLILLHPANDALRELKGCIAPVMSLLQKPGTGIRSRQALEKINALIFPALASEIVLLTIKKQIP